METVDPSPSVGDIPRSAEELVRRAVVTPGVLQEIQRNPGPALQKLAQEDVKDVPQSRPLDTDVLLYRVIVACLGAVMLVSALGVIALAIAHVAVPETLTALGSGAIGCLGGLLAPSPMKR